MKDVLIILIEWEKDINWKVHTTDRRIYIMRDHNWSFAAWEIEKLRGRINEKSLVVHVDAHLDDVPDGVLINNLMSAKTIDQIIELSKSYDRSLGQTSKSNIMRIDNFIWASLARETIEEVIYVSKDKQEVVTLEGIENIHDPESELILSMLPFNFHYRHKRFLSITNFFDSFSQHDFKKIIGDRTAILDLDIDTFNESDQMFEPNLTPFHEVREQVQKLMQLYPWDLVTIAISPEYCGGMLEAELLLENVLRVIDVDLKSTLRW